MALDRRRNLLLCAPALALPVLFLSPGEAVADGEGIRLEYGATAACPDRTTFEQRVAARNEHVRFVPSGEARSVDVRLVAGDRTATGSLTWRRGSVVEARRAMRAATCSELADALAFAVALSSQASAGAGDEPAAEPPGAPVDGGSPAATTPVPQAEAGPPAPAEPGAADEAPAASEAPADTAPAASSGRSPGGFFLGAAADLASGVAPDALIAASPFVGWTPDTHAPVAPYLRASFVRAGSGGVETPAGSVAFTWTVGRIDSCVAAWPFGRPPALRATACGRFEGGLLEASAAVSRGLDLTRAWLAAGPVLRIEWLRLAPLFLGVEGAAMFHITADRFFVLPDVTAYTVPYTGFEGAAALGVHFL